MTTEQRLRAFLTRDEVAQLPRAAKKSCHGAGNAAMILLAYRHGLCALDVTNLQVSDLERGPRDKLPPAGASRCQLG